MKVQDVATAAGHYVSGGSEYGWNCYPDAQFMDFSDIDGHEVAGCVYSRKTQDVYCVEAHVYEDDEINSVSYRWQDPRWVGACNTEAARRGVDHTVAYDNVYYTEVGKDEILELLNKIVHHTYVHSKKVAKDETIIGMSPKSGWPFPTGPTIDDRDVEFTDNNGMIWRALGKQQTTLESPSCGGDGCNGCCGNCGGDESECGSGCNSGDDEEYYGDLWRERCEHDEFDSDSMYVNIDTSQLDDEYATYKVEESEWEVVLTTKHRLDITARNYEEAVGKARAFKECIKAHEWGKGVCWVDHWISKETVTKRTNR